MNDKNFVVPPMGWNSWYCFSEGVSDRRIREAADGMVSRGLASHGWRYINVDDCWQGDRGGRYNALQGNERFPDMKGLGDYIHRLGLKFGIYSTPWICSYSGFSGSSTDAGREIPLRRPEEERLQKHQYYGTYPGGGELGLWRIGSEWRLDADVRQWDEWGVDFVKMDWNPNDLPTAGRIAENLHQAGRDILLSLSNTAPAENMPGLADCAQMWRISGDINDSWASISKIGFEIAPKWMRFASPGHWNDLDMLQIGNIGTAGSQNRNYRKSKLTFAEQQTQFVLWSLYSAPLLLSCDLAGMDDRTYELLSNDAIIAIDQDPLCAQPEITRFADEILRYEKWLSTGKQAVAFFNLSDRSRRIQLDMEGMDVVSGEAVCGTGTFAPHGCLVLQNKCSEKPPMRITTSSEKLIWMRSPLGED